MKKRDRRIVAVITILALLIGLILVKKGLDKAREDQETYQKALTDQLIERGEPDRAEAGTEENESGGTAGADADGANRPGDSYAEGTGGQTDAAAPESTGHTDASSGAAGSELPGEQPEELPGETTDGDGNGEQDAGTDAGDDTGAPGELLLPLPAEPDLGNPPVLDAAELSAGELTEWMTKHSGAAEEALDLYSKEMAVAKGVGSMQDPQRRAFAAQQAQPNYEARINRIALEASQLSYDYLQRKELLKQEETNLNWYREMLLLIAKKQQEERPEDLPDEDFASLQQLLAGDRKKIEDGLAAAEHAVASAKAALTDAAAKVKTAIGKEVTDPLELTGTLTLADAPAVSADEAAALALENRNEIKSALYAIQRTQALLEKMKYQYAPDAPERLEQEKELKRVQNAYPASRSSVEREVRNSWEQLVILRTQIKEKTEPQSEPEAPAYHVEGKKLEAEEEDGEERIQWSSDLDTVLGSWQKGIAEEVQAVTNLARYGQDKTAFDFAISVGVVPAEI